MLIMNYKYIKLVDIEGDLFIKKTDLKLWIVNTFSDKFF